MLYYRLYYCMFYYKYTLLLSCMHISCKLYVHCMYTVCIIFCVMAAISELFICVTWSKPGRGVVIPQSSMGFLMGLLTPVHG